MKNVALNEANSLQERIEKLDNEIKTLEEQPIVPDEKLVAIHDTLTRARKLLKKDCAEALKNLQDSYTKKHNDKQQQIAVFNSRRGILVSAMQAALGHTKPAPVLTSTWPNLVGSSIY